MKHFNFLTLIFCGLFSLATGIASHVIFYPIIENWNNARIRRLSRPAIGVLTNVVPFVIWLTALDNEDTPHHESIVKALAAYHLSFVWNGAGVVIGYLIGDWKHEGK